jgi:hypothetical protein
VAVVIVHSFPRIKVVFRTSTLSGITMANPMPGQPPPRGKPLRVSPYGLHPPRLAAHLWTYTTSWDINLSPTTSISIEPNRPSQIQRATPCAARGKDAG